MKLNVLGTEAACGTSTGAASNFGKSRYVRLFNTAAVGTEHLVTLEQSGGTDIGTVNIIYNIADLVNKTAFGLAIWAGAQMDSDQA